MKAEEQRIKIAEICGIPLVAYTFDYRHEAGWDTWVVTEDRDECEASRGNMEGEPLREVVNPKIPDYLGDLNAMHKAEKCLYTKHPDLWSDYIVAVEMITGSLSALHATAPQRAEAFLRTLNLWKP